MNAQHAYSAITSIRRLPVIVHLGKTNGIKYFSILLLALITLRSNAQLFHTMGYKGIDVSFGTRSFVLHSDVKELHQLNVLEAGGQLGIIFGNDFLRTKVGIAGFFYTNNRVSRTVDLFESDLAFNIYPLGKRNPAGLIQPYLTAGVVYDKTKFYGYYFSEDKGSINYSTSDEPFLGKVHQVSGAVGAGIELNVLNNDFNFIHIFSEAKYGIGIFNRSPNEAFKNTTFPNEWIINVGVRFGARDGILK